MSTSSSAAALNQTRQQRIETIMQQLRPKIEPTVRQMAERAVDVPQTQELGTIDFEFRDAGQKLANEIRQASLASRKKKMATWVPAPPVPCASMSPNSIPTKAGGS